MTNSIGVKMVLIPPGEFDMGSTDVEVEQLLSDASAFCQWFAGKEGKVYRLPTEAEWEYACRAGSTTQYLGGDDPRSVRPFANVADASFVAAIPGLSTWAAWSDRFPFTAPAGQFERSAFGLYDGVGNATEWCADWYRPDWYKQSPSDDPTGPASGSTRVVRGSSWEHVIPGCFRSSYRGGNGPNYRSVCTGFRLAMTLAPRGTLRQDIHEQARTSVSETRGTRDMPSMDPYLTLTRGRLRCPSYHPTQNALVATVRCEPRSAPCEHPSDSTASTSALPGVRRVPVARIGSIRWPEGSLS